MEKILLSVVASLLGVIGALIVYIWVSTLSKLYKDIDELKELKSQFDELLGEHNVLTCENKKGHKSLSLKDKNKRRVKRKET